MRRKIVIGQSGGCTAVINASLAGAVAQARRQAPDWQVWGAVHGVRGILNGQFIDLTSLDQEELRKLARTPAAALGSCRHKLQPGEAEAVLDQLIRVGARALIYMGGNDSADTANRIHQEAHSRGAALAVMGAPKTIDNDLAVTDHTPGYGSAARYLACAVADAGRDTQAMRIDEPVKIIEVSGRNSGWLACAATLAKRDEYDAPQIVWPPEVPFSSRRFLPMVKGWIGRIGYCVVVATETIRDRRKRPVAQAGREAPVDAFGHARVVGAAEFLCDLVRDRLKVRARWEKMGTIGRTATAHVSAVDRSEARRLGAAAVRYAMAGVSGREVVLIRRDGPRYGCAIGLASLEAIANTEKRLPAEMFDASGMLPTKVFLDYAGPLIGGALPQGLRLIKGLRGRGR